MASREGVPGIPPQSLIGLTHYLADFIEPVYLMIRLEVLSGHILCADETPHRMLEGSVRKSWYLWGFSTKDAVFFEVRDTRSGDVASDVLNESSCRYLMSDLYSGYTKAVNISNEYRVENGLQVIIMIYCNAHARRYFIRAEGNFKEESSFFIWCYQKIYHLIDQEKEDPNLKMNWP